MKQMIVNVGGLTIEEKQRVNEALAKIKNISKIVNVAPDMEWFYAPSDHGLHVGWNSILKSETPTHTPQQVLVMAERGHIHAELMLKYAEDAKTNPEPWKLWQFKVEGDAWCDCPRSPHWRVTTEYRRKPKTKLIHGVEIPVFEFTPKVGEKYYTANVGLPELFEHGYRSSEDCTFTHRMTERGLIYPYTEEGKQATILHSKAMLGIA